jgi:mRNA-degrading endonuclease RelE of RelBE toxin-antitoxin system
MKYIFELYNECDGSICSTPANTLGMGNPMLPGENGEVGSEPICAKCKKEKVKKKKSSEDSKIKEGLLSDMEDNLKIGKNESEFIELTSNKCPKCQRARVGNYRIIFYVSESKKNRLK